MKENSTILLVDDSKSDRVLFRQVLNLLDQSVICIEADSGKAALDYLSGDEQPPDYIFLDVSMPGMDGIECLREIKKIKKAKHIPVFMYSSSHVSSYKEAALALGAQACISKSLDLFETCEEIASFIQEEAKEVHH